MRDANRKGGASMLHIIVLNDASSNPKDFSRFCGIVRSLDGTLPVFYTHSVVYVWMEEIERLTGHPEASKMIFVVKMSHQSVDTEAVRSHVPSITMRAKGGLNVWNSRIERTGSNDEFMEVLRCYRGDIGSAA